MPPKKVDPQGTSFSEKEKSDCEFPPAPTFVIRGDGRHDLIHYGRPSETYMLSRWLAFAARFPDLDIRAGKQQVRNMLKYRGWT